MLPSLRSRLDLLTAKRKNFEATTRAMSERQLRFRPAEGAWSIAEVAQHLLQVEREVLKAVVRTDVERRDRRRSTREWIGYVLFLGIVSFDIRIRVPQKVAGRVTPSVNPDMAELWREWAEVHAGFAEYLEAITAPQLGDMAFRHPIMGPTPVRGMVPFFLKHFDHHMRQVRRIRGSADFPEA